MKSITSYTLAEARERILDGKKMCLSDWDDGKYLAGDLKRMCVINESGEIITDFEDGNWHEYMEHEYVGKLCELTSRTGIKIIAVVEEFKNNEFIVGTIEYVKARPLVKEEISTYYKK